MADPASVTVRAANAADIPAVLGLYAQPDLDDGSVLTVDQGAALQLFGAGREKRIYAIPPYTQVVSLDFEDHPFEPYRHDAACALCGSTDSFLDEVITDDRGSRMFLCSDTDYCEAQRARGPEAAAPPVHPGEAGHG